MKKRNLVLIGMMVLALLVLPMTTLAKVQPWQDWTNAQVSDANSYFTFNPEMAYRNGVYGIVYYDHRDGNTGIYLSIIKKTGEKVGNDLKIAEGIDPTIVSNDEDFGIVWYSSWNIYYSRVSKTGQILVDKKVIAGGVHPSITWNKTTQNYGLTWWGDADGVPGIKFVRLDINGNVLGEIITLNSVFDGGYARPRIANSGNDYGIAWNGYRTGTSEVFFASVDNNGAKKSDDVQLTNSGNQGVWQITWDGSNYAMITDGNLGRALIQVDANGNLIQTYILNEITAGSNFGITWFKDRYVLSFSSDIFSTPGNYRIDIVKAEYNENGEMVSDLKQISTLPGYNYYPSNFVYTGNRLAVSWVSDLWGPNQKIYFAQGVD